MARPLLLPFLAVVVAYWGVSHVIATFFAAFGMLPAPTWPAASVALAAALLFGWRAAPGIAIGSILANTVSLGAPVPLALGIAVMNTVGPLVAAALIRRHSRGTTPLGSVHDVFVFVLFGVVVHAALTATGGVANLIAFGRVAPEAADMVLLRWWTAHATGSMLFAPVILGWWHHRRIGLARGQMVEAALVSGITVLATAFVFLGSVDSAHAVAGLPFLLVVPLAWVATRFRPRDAASVIPLVAIIAAMGTVMGRGAFHQHPGSNPMAALGLMLLAYSATALILAALAEERRVLVNGLREQHEFADALVDHTASLIVVMDPDGNVLRFNHACRRLTGYSEDDVRGRAFWNTLMLPDERPAAERVLASLRIGISPLHHENHLITRDNGPRLVAWEYTVVRGDDGQVEHIIGSGQDVTDARWVDAELRKLAVVAARTSNSVIITDAAGNIEWVNEGFRRVSGYSLAEVKGRKPGAFLQGAETDPATIAYMRERMEAGEGFQAEVLNYAKDGHKYWVEVDVQPALAGDGSIERYIAIETDITDRRRSEDAQRHLLQILEAARDIVSSSDTEGNLTYMNEAGRRALGIGLDEDIGAMSIASLHPPQAREKVLMQALPAAHKHGFWEGENEFITSDGHRIPVWQVIVAHKNAEGAVQYYSTIARDIASRRDAEADLRLAASVYHNTIEGIVITDPNGIILSVNPAFTEITGYSAEEAIGQTPRLLKSDHHDNEFYAAMWVELKANGQWKGELWNRRKGGDVFLEHQTISMVPGPDGRPVRYVALFNDITELRRKDERIRHLAYHDPLTALPNRQLLHDRLEHGLAVCRREDKQMAVMFLDLDRFKVINDTLGHDVGDNLLREVARRLTESVRSTDTVARLGGDEFVVLVESPESPRAVAQVAEKIIHALTFPVELGENTVHVTTSIGISLFPDDGDDLTELMKNADTAMYAAKSAGRNGYHFFSPTMNDRAQWRLELENEMRQALDRQEFELYYQPKVDMATMQPCGAEALIRWRHPTKGIISPADFIPLAEETGLIVPMGEWALLDACSQMRRWRDDGLGDIQVAVNLSARQLVGTGLYALVSGALELNELPPGLLELELTESAVMHETERAIAMLEGLKTLGVSIAIDDFGTGYSSLSYLKKLPLDTLKIDRSFVMDIESNEQDAAIVRTILAMAETLRLSVVAEGVETQSQVDFLAANNCAKVQGYFFSKPLPAADFAAWVRRHKTVEEPLLSV